MKRFCYPKPKEKEYKNYIGCEFAEFPGQRKACGQDAIYCAILEKPRSKNGSCDPDVTDELYGSRLAELRKGPQNPSPGQD